jgi:tetratricopeptide (TPR) repeat protein
MRQSRNVLVFLLLLTILPSPCWAQFGKYVSIPAGSEADHQLSAISAATDAAQKLQLIDEFAKAHSVGDLAIVADEQYVNYYLEAKQYDKAFEYGDKLFALDPDNFSNAVNMVRAANEKGDVERLFGYGEKAGGIIQRYKSMPAPSGTSPNAWIQQKADKLSGIKENEDYVEQSLLNMSNQQKEPAKRSDLLVRFSKIFPDSPNAERAMTMAAFGYQQAQSRAKMVEVANGVLAKDPYNIGILLLLADDYSEKDEQLDKAEGYAKKAAALCETVKKPEGVSDADWQNQNSLQKGLALSALGEVNLQKKQNAQAVEALTKAAPLLKSNATSYARNQYRLGFAYLNLKKLPEAKQALTEAASVDSPYRGPAQEKLKGLGTAKTAVKKAS